MTFMTPLNSGATCDAYYLCAAPSAGTAVGAWFYLPSPFLILFTAACSGVFVIAGYSYMRSAS